MVDASIIYNKLKEQAALPLFYHPDYAVCEQTIQSLYDGGMRIVEFTNRGVQALGHFTQLLKKRNADWPDMILAIGTIKTPAQATAFLNVGADLVICPGTVPAVGETVQAAGKPWIPGAMTVSEILLAQATGAEFIKLFPGNLLGPSFMAGIRDIFPELSFMPTGGVELTIDNLQAWFRAGVSAVGLGSKFLSKELLASGDYNKVREDAKRALELVHQVK